MSFFKKIIVHILGYSILALNTIAANHLTPNSNIVLGQKFITTAEKSAVETKSTEKHLPLMFFSHHLKILQ